MSKTESEPGIRTPAPPEMLDTASKIELAGQSSISADPTARRQISRQETIWIVDLADKSFE
jgi:hypothetical protein